MARLVRMTKVAMVVSIGDDAKVAKGGELIMVERAGRVARVALARVASKDSKINQRNCSEL